MKIFLGLTEIAGYYSSLREGFNEIGVEAVHIDLSGNRLDYSAMKHRGFLKLLLEWIPKDGDIVGSPNIVWKAARLLMHLILKIPLFVYAVLKFDVFIFGYNSRFFSFLHLPILKLLGKKVIYVFHGSDCRPPYLSGYVMSPGKNVSLEQCVRMTRQKKRMIDRIEKHSDFIINHPPQAHFNNRPYVTHMAIGLSVNTDLFEEVPSSVTNDTRAVRILHAPSNPAAKGTSLIRSTIDELKSQGHLIEWVEITGRPHKEVLQALKSCDFVIDELYSDTPMAGFAAEAAFFAKPSIVGGYYSAYLPNDFRQDMLPPSVFCAPDRLREAILELIENVEFRLQLGQAAREYVLTRWHPRIVAGNFIKLLEGQSEPGWWADPKKNMYLHGCGIDEFRLRALVRDIVERFGPGALMLDDKPQLRDRLLEFSASETSV